MATKNYKLSCIGIDPNGSAARLQFCVYNVKSIADAQKQVREDKMRQKMMRQNNIDYKTIELRAVRCTVDGEPADMKKENKIIEAENAEVRHMYFEMRQRSHPWLNLTEI